jgi:peptide/nickel transport system ATP-binding protein
MTMGESTPIVRVDGLWVAYRGQRGEVPAVRGVSFDVGPGETVGLIGESGSGKSTISLAIMGLLPANAKVIGGTIQLSGGGNGRTASPGHGPKVRGAGVPRADPASQPTVDLLQLSDRQLRTFRWSAVALVPQGAISALNPVLRVGEHFEETAAAHEYPLAAARAQARELIERVRLDPDQTWRAYPHELSGGMRQRVLIALALLLRPRLLVLDEPTTALDTITQRSILDVLQELRRSEDLAILFISHDLAVAAELSDRIVTMYAGQVVEVGMTAELVARSHHPYTIGLLEAIPRLHGDNAGVRAIPGSPPDLARLPAGCPFVPRCPLAATVCIEQDPDLVAIATRHSVACHRWAEAGALRVVKDDARRDGEAASA